MKMEITINKILSLSPCDRYSEDKLLALSGGRREMDFREIMELQIPDKDAVWLGIRLLSPALKKQIFCENCRDKAAIHAATAIAAIYQGATFSPLTKYIVSMAREASDAAFRSAGTAGYRISCGAPDYAVACAVDSAAYWGVKAFTFAAIASATSSAGVAKSKERRWQKQKLIEFLEME